MKKIFFFAAVLACLLIINNLARSIYDLWHKQDLVVKAQKDLEREKKENEQLKKQLSRVKSNVFIEEEARNKLFMVKEGESGVILPVVSSTRSAKPTQEPPNWQKWFNLLF